jgi:ABC-type transporter Mla subunit MlaD
MTEINIFQQLQSFESVIKVNEALQKKFNNNISAISEAVHDTANRIQERAKDYESLLNGGIAAQLAAFRKEVGEDMWQTIATNPGINDLVLSWMKDQRNKMPTLVVEEFRKILPDNHGLTDQDILNYVCEVGK